MQIKGSGMKLGSIIDHAAVDSAIKHHGMPAAQKDIAVVSLQLLQQGGHHDQLMQVSRHDITNYNPWIGTAATGEMSSEEPTGYRRQSWTVLKAGMGGMH